MGITFALAIASTFRIKRKKQINYSFRPYLLFAIC